METFDNIVFGIVIYVSIGLPFQLMFTEHFKEKRRRKRSRARIAAQDRLRRSLYRDVMGYECQLSDSQLSSWLMVNGHYERYQEDWRAIRHNYPE